VSAGVSVAAKNVRMRLGKRKAVQPFELSVDSVHVPAGEVLAVLGPSGAGKSTLLEVLGLLREPDQGEVFYDDRRADPASREDHLLSAAVFQRPWLFKGPVSDNVAYGLSVRNVPRKERDRIVAEELARVGLTGREKDSALRLSGGEAQRVSLARALAVRPSILLLDEPLASLDALLKRQLAHEFVSILRDTGVTVVWVTHDQDEAQLVADRIAVMDKGRVVACGTAEEVLGLPKDEWLANFLGVPLAQEGVVREASEGLSAIEVGPNMIWAAGEADPGTRVRMSVRPEDVLLFEPGAELPETTARNQLNAEVTCVEPRGATFRVEVEASGMRLASSVSRISVRELGLVPGARVLAVFKATAVRWAGISAGGGDEATPGCA
jgi:tungstate transport system ATP-binding protein